MNALVVGVSADRPEVQQRFIDKFDLTFPLVSARSKAIIDAYGAREVLGVTAKRSTFLVAPNGRIAWAWPDYVPAYLDLATALKARRSARFDTEPNAQAHLFRRLQRAYDDFTRSSPLQQRVFKVLKDHDPSRPVAPGQAFVSLDDILEPLKLDS